VKEGENEIKFSKNNNEASLQDANIDSRMFISLEIWQEYLTPHFVPNLRIIILKGSTSFFFLMWWRLIWY
jgi:hypothetical protein